MTNFLNRLDRFNGLGTVRRPGWRMLT